MIFKQNTLNMQRQLLKYFLFVLLGLSRRLFVFSSKVELKDGKWLFSLEKLFLVNKYKFKDQKFFEITKKLNFQTKEYTSRQMAYLQLTSIKVKFLSKCQFKKDFTQ